MRGSKEARTTSKYGSSHQLVRPVGQGRIDQIQSRSHRSSVVLVNEGEHHEASTQPASVVELGLDVAVDEDVVAALQI